MVAGDIGDGGDVELHTGGAALLEGVAGEFDGGVRRLVGDHRLEPLGQGP
jgi:hypothetical protein